MGIYSLMKYCTNEYNKHKIFQTVNLVQVARQRHGVELLVNCHRFQNYFAAKLWYLLASQSNNHYLKILGGEHYSFHIYFQKLIEDLKSVGISLVFFVDGDTQAISDERLKTTSQIDDIMAICDGQKDITELGRNHPRSPLQRVQFSETLKQCGCEMITVLAGEINYEIAKVLQKRPNAYVLCNDSDFCVFKNCRFIHYTMFDVDNDLQLNKPIDERAQPTKIMAEVMTTQNLMTSLNIRHFSLLVELSIVAGNGFTSEYMLGGGLKDKLDLKGRRGLGSIAGLVKRYTTVESIPQIREEMNNSQKFSEAVSHSRKFFNLTLPASKLNKNSKLTMIIENGIQTGKFPHYVMGFHNNIYCHRLVVENNSSGHPSSEDAIEHLRAHIYRIVLPREETVVKEYGRITSMVEVHAVNDDKIPTLDSINERDILVNRKHFHYVMTHLERGMKVTLVKGRIELEQVDALACAIDSNLNLACSGTAAKSLLTAGGKSLLAECKAVTDIKNYKDVMSIRAGNLKCKHVYLTILPDVVEEKDLEKNKRSETSDTEKVLYNRIFRILRRAIEDGIKSIALPALGTGKLNYTSETVARIMFDCVKRNKLTNGSLSDVKLVLYDKSTFEAFEEVFKEGQHADAESDENKLWFDEFDSKSAFKIYILRYFLLLNWNRNLQVSEDEFTALMALVIEKQKPESYYQAICLRPNIRCLTLGSWFQNVYKHAYKYLGKLLYLSHEQPAPHEVFCGSAWTAYYACYLDNKETAYTSIDLDGEHDLLETTKVKIVGINTEKENSADENVEWKPWKFESKENTDNNQNDDMGNVGKDSIRKHNTGGNRKSLFCDLRNEIVCVIKENKELVKHIINDIFNLDHLF